MYHLEKLSTNLLVLPIPYNNDEQHNDYSSCDDMRHVSRVLQQSNNQARENLES